MFVNNSGGESDPLDEYGKVERSLRLRRSASASLFRTVPATGNRRKWSLIVMFKIGDLPFPEMYIAGNSNGANNGAHLRLNSGGALSFADQVSGAHYRIVSSATLRDHCAHYIVQFDWDSDNPTASERMRMYINGVRVTQFAESNIPPINTDSSWNSTSFGAHAIGRNNYNGYYFDGSLSSILFVDGSNPIPDSAIGRFHPRTGQYRPFGESRFKALADAAGANSFYLPFSNAASAVTIAADASIHGNNWTASNISLTPGPTYDSMLDTPTNNFCSLNPLVQRWAYPNASISKANLSVTAPSNSYSYALGTMQVKSGKWYFEVTCTSVGSYSPAVGIADYQVQNNINTNIIEYVANGTHTGSGTAWSTFTTGDVIGVAIDADSRIVYFYKNGVQQGSVSTGYDVNYTPYLAIMGGGVLDANFGQQPFYYSQPAGFKSLCTKNLPFPKIDKSSNAFASTTNSGANIVGALESISPWNSWIRIYKRRDLAEGWVWQFSDDEMNCLDSSSTAAKAAFPALTGTSYVGYALKVSTQNGVATGRLVHTNGVASVVTDGLANSRKAVMLRSEAGGNWFFYHPELTAGKLLYLNSTAAETTDNAINTVTANDFKVASALASGTYRWVAIAEVEGFTKLGKYLGNGAANGAMSVAGLTPGLTFVKNSIGAVVNWMSYDTAMNQGNPAGYLSPSLTNAEASDVLVDVVSNGLKMRSTSPNINQGGSTYVTLSIAAFPFRYTNAR